MPVTKRCPLLQGVSIALPYNTHLSSGVKEIGEWLEMSEFGWMYFFFSCMKAKEWCSSVSLFQ